MADCTTFDLLLVDWLYDELEPAEAARFTRHIDGCDACWQTAETMTRMRALMRELPEEMPSQVVSARILHQAAEQVAGARRRGLWAWLAGSLEMAWAHPAAAALATMVLIAGVAGALFARGKLEMAAPATSPASESAQLRGGDALADGSESAPGAPPAAPPQVVAQPSEKSMADLAPAEEQRDRASRARGKLSRAGAPAGPAGSMRIDRPEERPAPDSRRAPAALAMDLELAAESDPTQEQQAAPVEDDESSPDRVGAAASLGAGRAAAPAAGMTTSTPAGAATAKPGDAAGATPPTASSPKPGAAPESQREGEGEGEGEGERKGERNSDKPQRAQPRQEAAKRDDRPWAETMHDALRAALRQAECARAVQIAEDIRAREPGYFRALIANSKELAACRQPSDSGGKAGKNRASGAN